MLSSVTKELLSQHCTTCYAEPKLSISSQLIGQGKGQMHVSACVTMMTGHDIYGAVVVVYQLLSAYSICITVVKNDSDSHDYDDDHSSDNSTLAAIATAA
ncbi:putative cysteine-rich receptor-like protein kinase [Dirofilaria immitis]